MDVAKRKQTAWNPAAVGYSLCFDHGRAGKIKLRLDKRISGVPLLDGREKSQKPAMFKGFPLRKIRRRTLRMAPPNSCETAAVETWQRPRSQSPGAPVPR